MTKQEIQDQHDAAVKQAIANTLDSWLKDADLTGDDCDVRILEALVNTPAAAYAAHELWAKKQADDATDDEYWFVHFDMQEAVSSVLWWHLHGRESLTLDDVGVPCIGGAPFRAFAVFVSLARVKMDYRTDLDILIEDATHSDDDQVRLTDAVKGMPNF